MKYCLRCQKEVNVHRREVDISIAMLWNDHCEECGMFIDSGVIISPNEEEEENE